MSNIVDLITEEDRLNEIVDSVAEKLVHDINYDNYLKSHIQGFNYNYLKLIRESNTRNYYFNNTSDFKLKNILWCVIELKLAVWLSNYYKDKVTHEPPF